MESPSGYRVLNTQDAKIELHGLLSSELPAIPLKALCHQTIIERQSIVDSLCVVRELHITLLCKVNSGLCPNTCEYVPQLSVM
jgi:hypothetical protein